MRCGIERGLEAIAQYRAVHARLRRSKTVARQRIRDKAAQTDALRREKLSAELARKLIGTLQPDVPAWTRVAAASDNLDGGVAQETFDTAPDAPRKPGASRHLPLRLEAPTLRSPAKPQK